MMRLLVIVNPARFQTDTLPTRQAVPKKKNGDPGEAGSPSVMV
jgi:hypothetical protein